MTTKKCSICGKELELSEFGKDTRSKDMHRSACKSCYSIANGLYRDNHKTELKQYRIDNKTYQKQYRKERKKEIKQYYIDNKEEILIKKAIYYENNKEYISARRKQYVLKNKDKINTNQSVKRFKIKQLLSTLTVKEWEGIKLFFNNSCCYCGRQVPLHHEHFVPIKKGGGYTLKNILCCCKRCNSSKGAKDFEDWYPRFKFYDEHRMNRILEYLKSVNNVTY